MKDGRKPWDRGWDNYLNSIGFASDDEYVEYDGKLDPDVAQMKNWFKIAERENKK